MINGAYLKQARKANHYTLAELSKATGYTASFLSQIERGLKEPSLTALRKLSECLKIPVASLLIAESDPLKKPSSTKKAAFSIVRGKDRKIVPIPELNTKFKDISPVADGGNKQQLCVMLYTITPGEYCSEGMVCHPYNEFSYLLNGSLLALVGKKQVTLQAGDCIYVFAQEKHNFQNIGPAECTLLTVSN